MSLDGDSAGSQGSMNMRPIVWHGSCKKEWAIKEIDHGDSDAPDRTATEREVEKWPA